MAKLVSDYTPQELQEIGLKTVEARIRDASAGKEKAKLTSALYKAWKDGKVTGPGIPPPPK